MQRCGGSPKTAVRQQLCTMLRVTKTLTRAVHPQIDSSHVLDLKDGRKATLHLLDLGVHAAVTKWASSAAARPTAKASRVAPSLSTAASPLFGSDRGGSSLEGSRRQHPDTIVGEPDAGAAD